MNAIQSNVRVEESSEASLLPADDRFETTPEEAMVDQNIVLRILKTLSFL